MNERILELAYQAANGMLSYDAEGEWRLSEKEVKKFAELLIRECAEICLEANDHKNILRHFGVEHVN